MTLSFNILSRAAKKIASLLSLVFIVGTMASCVEITGEGGEGLGGNAVAVASEWPTGLSATGATGSVAFTEVNSRRTMSYALPLDQDISVATGLYDIEGRATLADGTTVRAVQQQVAISGPTALTLSWFRYNANSTLVISEIYFTGSPNATHTGGLRDTYLRIYNNSDHVVYADGLGIAESAFINAEKSTYEILTPANDRNVNFTAGTMWVIPGSGTDVPIEPGQSIKIVDQALNWAEQVDGALDHTDANFEWYDDNHQDLDTPATPNLDKWYCYSLSIWLPSNQCNRSYALVGFPSGMTAEQWLRDYYGKFDYISILGTQMTNEKAYLVPNDWIIDGVNLGNSETYIHGAVADAIDVSFASISDTDRDPSRFGQVFARQTETTLPDGRRVLRDTNDSANDFARVPVATLNAK